MGRAHVWQFVLTQEGQPVPGASISMATGDPSAAVVLYTSLTGETTASRVLTDNYGLFKFWVGDRSETYGYATNTTFNMTISAATITPYIIENMQLHWPAPRLYTYTIPTWLGSANAYYADVVHNLGTRYPIVTIWVISTGYTAINITTESVDTNTTRFHYNGGTSFGADIHVTLIGDDIVAT